MKQYCGMARGSNGLSKKNAISKTPTLDDAMCKRMA